VDSTPISVGARDIMLFTTPVKHNLQVGSNVRITNLTNGNLDNTYTVIRLGDFNGNSEEYIFGVDMNGQTTQTTQLTKMKRVIEGYESEYYFRKFESI